MKPVLSVLALAAICFSCNPSRNDGRNAAAYDVITEKSYIVRNTKPLPSDSLTNIILLRQEEMARLLEKNGFKKHMAAKDSLLFRRDNGQEVMIELPAPEDAWQANAIIAFDPHKSPLFINLKKDSTQVTNYIK